jgi:protein-tyrosine phosphatase
MLGYIDLHCHFVAGIDDGARTVEEGVAMLHALYRVGFSHVTATPHMRPGMFENSADDLRASYTQFEEAYRALPSDALPSISLASEHFFDAEVYERLLRGEGLPYPPLPGSGTRPPPRPGARTVRPFLLEFPTQVMPPKMASRIVDLKRAGLRPVIAHPERYRSVWIDDSCLDPLLDGGAVLLLDVCAVVGKYGKASQEAAEKLLEEEAYEAACSDAHRPEDAEFVARAIERLTVLVGATERDRLLRDAPAQILAG